MQRQQGIDLNLRATMSSTTWTASQSHSTAPRDVLAPLFFFWLHPSRPTSSSTKRRNHGFYRKKQSPAVDRILDQFGTPQIETPRVGILGKTSPLSSDTSQNQEQRHPTDSGRTSKIPNRWFGASGGVNTLRVAERIVFRRSYAGSHLRNASHALNFSA